MDESLGPGKHCASLDEVLGVSCHARPPDVPLENEESSVTAWMASNSRGVGPLEEVRVQTSIDIEMSRQRVGQRWFQDLPLANYLLTPTGEETG